MSHYIIWSISYGPYVKPHMKQGNGNDLSFYKRFSECKQSKELRIGDLTMALALKETRFLTKTVLFPDDMFLLHN